MALILKLPRQRNHAREQVHVLAAGNFDSTKLLEMRGQPLRVEKCETLRAQSLDQADEGDL